MLHSGNTSKNRQLAPKDSPQGGWLRYLVMLLALWLGGCASAQSNVRALRMYQHEQPTPALLEQHINEMDQTLQLIDEMLNRTPYQPGASWVTQLPLDGEKAEQARSLIKDAETRASFVAVYAMHVREVLKQPALPAVPGLPVTPALPSTPEVPSPPQVPSPLSRFDSLSQALAAARPDAPRLPIAPGQPPALPLPPELAQLAATEQGRIVEDALVTTSVAIRLTAEAMALATVIVLESASLAGPRSSQWLTGAPDAAHLAAALPDRARSIYGRLESDLSGLRRLFDQLSKQRVNLADTAAFAFKSGLVDDLVGVALDSVHLDLEAGGDALFYAAIADDEKSTNRDGSFDYTGRLTKLEYDTEPIVLASANLKLKVDWPHWAEALGVNFGYATSRVYKSGGDIETGSFANELGVKNRFSDAVDAALGIAGVKASVRIAHFTQGTVRDVLVEDDSELASAPFAFDLKQIDLSYDFLPKRGGALQSFALGVRYFDYTLPRILYELVNSTPDAEQAAYVYSRETPPQRMRTRFYMGTLTARFEKPLTPHLTPYLSLDLGVGYGPTEYYFLRDIEQVDEEQNREHTKSNSLGIATFGMLGIRWFVANPESRLNVFLDVNYHVQSISSVLNPSNDENTVVTTGSTDLFHGPTGSLGATF